MQTWKQVQQHIGWLNMSSVQLHRLVVPISALRKLASSSEGKFDPETVKTVERNMYVDDFDEVCN